MRILVCGGRHFEDADRVHRELSHLHWCRPLTVLAHGGLAGIGPAAEAWARRAGIAVVRYPPNWEFFGRKAEGLRNAFMFEDSAPDLVLAFPGGRHTADLIARARDTGVAVLVVPPEVKGEGPFAGEDLWSSSTAAAPRPCPSPR